MNEPKDAVEEKREEAPKKVYGPKSLCPKCGKVPARYLHVKWCKGV